MTGAENQTNLEKKRNKELHIKVDSDTRSCGLPLQNKRK